MVLHMDEATPRHPPCGGCGLKYAGTIRQQLTDGGHPPCGGCGLKSLLGRFGTDIPPVTLHAEGVD